MRGLVISLILFAILLILITSNFFYVNKVIGNMTNEAHSLKEIPSEENTKIINRLKKDWEQKSIWLSFSVSSDDLEELSDIIDSLEAANKVKNVNQFQIHKALLLNAIEKIGRLEKLSIKNIL